MRKWMLVVTATIFALAISAGCSQKNENLKQQGMVDDGMMLRDKNFSNDQLNSANRNKGNNLIGNHKNYRMEMSKEIADKVVAQLKADSAYVMLTENNAYVAVMLNNQASEQQLSDDIKQKVTKVVNAEQPKIDNVYVSANADFFGRMKGYMDEVAAGHPIKGFMSEFNEMVDRVFPTTTSDTRDFKGLTQDGDRIFQK